MVKTIKDPSCPVVQHVMLERIEDGRFQPSGLAFPASRKTDDIVRVWTERWGAPYGLISPKRPLLLLPTPKLRDNAAVRCLTSKQGHVFAYELRVLLRVKRSTSALPLPEATRATVKAAARATGRTSHDELAHR